MRAHGLRKIGETREVQWHPHGESTPEGARNHGPAPGHHGHYSSLIEKVSMSDRLNQFDAVTKTVVDERGAVYAHPSIDFDRAARMKAVLAECKNPLTR